MSDVSELTVTVELDWADPDGAVPPREEGLFIEDRGIGGGGHPTYRVTAPLPALVSWLVRHYVGFDPADVEVIADNLALAFESATLA